LALFRPANSRFSHLLAFQFSEKVDLALDFEWRQRFTAAISGLFQNRLLAAEVGLLRGKHFFRKPVSRKWLEPCAPTHYIDKC